MTEKELRELMYKVFTNDPYLNDLSVGRMVAATNLAVETAKQMKLITTGLDIMNDESNSNPTPTHMVTKHEITHNEVKTKCVLFLAEYGNLLWTTNWDEVTCTVCLSRRYK